ncbi:MAG: Ig-like domain-containing protein [Clostridia bacterium]|nr:Ig-like domain-containing protein [Clostridia bacterium]
MKRIITFVMIVVLFVMAAALPASADTVTQSWVENMLNDFGNPETYMIESPISKGEFGKVIYHLFGKTAKESEYEYRNCADYKDAKNLTEDEKEIFGYLTYSKILTVKNGYFYKNYGITRAEIASALSRLKDLGKLNLKAVKTVNFSDIKKHWAEKYIKLVASSGVMNGVSGGKFSPNVLFTRAQTLKLAENCIGKSSKIGSRNEIKDAFEKALGWQFKPINLSYIYISLSDSKLKVGETQRYTVTLNSNATIRDINFRVINNKVEIVKYTSDKNTIYLDVKGISDGQSGIVVEAKNGNRSFTATISVFSPIIPELKLSDTYTFLKPGETKKLTYTTIPASNDTVTWRSENGNIAFIKEDGTIYAVSQGLAYVKATSSSGSEAYCYVYVHNGQYTRLSSMYLSTSTVNLKQNESATIDVNMYPQDASIKKIFVKSSNSNIAVYSDGKIIAKNETGNALLTFETYDGNIQRTVMVQVSPNVPTQSITITGVSEIYVGNNSKLTATKIPDSSDTIYWSSNNNNMATVAQDGTVYGINPGVVTISAYTQKGITGSKQIEVKTSGSNSGYIAVNGVILNVASFILTDQTTTYQLAAYVTPINATYKNVSWSTSNANVAVVDSNGLVTRVGIGTAEISAKTLDGGYTAKAVVEVKNSGTGTNPVVQGDSSIYFDGSYTVDGKMLRKLIITISNIKNSSYSGEVQKNIDFGSLKQYGSVNYNSATGNFETYVYEPEVSGQYIVMLSYCQYWKQSSAVLTK